MKKSRRNFIRKAAYAAPAVLTLASMPAIASAGSREQEVFEADVAETRWQSRERRRYVRRMERLGTPAERFNDWSRIDKETWTIKD